MAQSPYAAFDDATWSTVLAKATVLRACSNELLDLHQMVELGRATTIQLLMTLHRDAVAAAEESDPGILVRRVCGIFCCSIEQARAAGACEDDEYLVLEQVAAACRAGIAPGDPFQQLFDGFAARAADLYANSWPDVIHHELEWNAAHPRPHLNDHYPITAATEFGRQSRTVTVTFQPRPVLTGLWPLVPRLISHELIAHVGACDTGPVNNESPFAEGLMDWASLHYLARWLPQDWPVLWRAAEYHAERAEPILVPAALASPRLLGHKAAFSLRRRQIRAGVALDAADARTARFAVRLNAVECPLDYNDALIVELASGTRRATDERLDVILAGELPPDDLL